MGCVYLLGDWDKENRYKIGVTRGDVQKRIKKLQTGNSGEIYLISKYETEYPFLMEKLLHSQYAVYRVLNEWFELSDEDVLLFQERCKEVDGIIEALKDNYYFRKKLIK
jgi:porphobilinogen deaminase